MKNIKKFTTEVLEPRTLLAAAFEVESGLNLQSFNDDLCIDMYHVDDDGDRNSIIPEECYESTQTDDYVFYGDDDEGFGPDQYEQFNSGHSSETSLLKECWDHLTWENVYTNGLKAGGLAFLQGTADYTLTEGLQVAHTLKALKGSGAFSDAEYSDIEAQLTAPKMHAKRDVHGRWVTEKYEPTKLYNGMTAVSEFTHKFSAWILDNNASWGEENWSLEQVESTLNAGFKFNKDEVASILERLEQAEADKAAAPSIDDVANNGDEQNDSEPSVSATPTPSAPVRYTPVTPTMEPSVSATNSSTPVVTVAPEAVQPSPYVSVATSATPIVTPAPSITHEPVVVENSGVDNIDVVTSQGNEVTLYDASVGNQNEVVISYEELYAIMSQLSQADASFAGFNNLLQPQDALVVSGSSMSDSITLSYDQAQAIMEQLMQSQGNNTSVIEVPVVEQTENSVVVPTSTVSISDVSENGGNEDSADEVLFVNAPSLEQRQVVYYPNCSIWDAPEVQALGFSPAPEFVSNEVVDTEDSNVDVEVGELESAQVVEFSNPFVPQSLISGEFQSTIWDAPQVESVVVDEIVEPVVEVQLSAAELQLQEIQTVIDVKVAGVNALSDAESKSEVGLNIRLSLVESLKELVTLQSEAGNAVEAQKTQFNVEARTAEHAALSAKAALEAGNATEALEFANKAVEARQAASSIATELGWDQAAAHQNEFAQWPAGMKSEASALVMKNQFNVEAQKAEQAAMNANKALETGNATEAFKLATEAVEARQAASKLAADLGWNEAAAHQNEFAEWPAGMKVRAFDLAKNQFDATAKKAEQAAMSANNALNAGNAAEALKLATEAVEARQAASKIAADLGWNEAAAHQNEFAEWPAMIKAKAANQLQA